MYAHDTILAVASPPGRARRGIVRLSGARTFDVLRERRKPTIALCMGPFGEMSRVLAPKFGGLLTFAAEAEDAPTAPGQLTIAELRRLRYDAISAATRVYGVIGWPVGHSRSPDVHNAGFEAVGHDGVYLPLPIPPEPEHLKATLGAFLDHAALDFAGASVTIPHKTNVLQFVEARGGTIDPLAARVGAANTLVVRDGRLVCANTDVDAAIDALTAAMNVDRAALADQRALVLGAGGVARAVVAGLADAGAVVAIAARRPDRAAALASDLDAGTGRVSAAEVSELAGERFDVIVNATPVGMTGGPAPGESPLPDGVTIDDGVTVLDTVYSPSRTPLLEDVATRGARIVPGIEMFIRQAARQFELWTGQTAPEPVFRRALLATD